MDLACLEYGDDGSPVVILHGLFGSARNWTSVAKALAEEYRVYALDLRNHGDSPWAERMDYAVMADDVRGFIEKRKLEDCAVIGHSMGGKAAMTLALGHPQAVARLMVVDIAPVASKPRPFLDYAEAMRRADVASATRRGDVEDQLRETIPDASVRAFLLQNLVRADGGYAWRVNLDVLIAHMETIAGFPDFGEEAVYRGPTLMLAGERSDYVRDEHLPTIRRLFPKGVTATVADAGHWLHAERPEAFLDHARRFLSADD